MRYRFDQIGKQIGEEALGPLGRTVVHDEISLDARYADISHEPDPARATERDQLGLLGRIASSLCLIELYSDAPGGSELRACLGKYIGFWQQREREHRKKQKPPATFVEPSLWIIAAVAPVVLVPGAEVLTGGDPLDARRGSARSNPPEPLRRATMTELGFAPAPGWPSGVYSFGSDVLHVRLVAANELPRDRATVLVRLMAAGPLLSQAITDLRKLPDGAPERAVAEQILLRLQHALEQKPLRSAEEEEFIVTMHEGWEDARKQGQKQGWEQASAHAVLTVLRARGIPVPEAARERILAESDPERLERWLERASVETSLAAVLDKSG
jgi:hypothetical protein